MFFQIITYSKTFPNIQNYIVLSVLIIIIIYQNQIWLLYNFYNNKISNLQRQEEMLKHSINCNLFPDKFYLFIFKIALLITIVTTSQTISEPQKQHQISLTIYNNNFAIVKDTRQIVFAQGQSTLYFVDVSATMQPQTVTLKYKNNQNKLQSPVRVYQQNYDSNLMNYEKITSKHIQKLVTIYTQLDQANINNDNIISITGKLLANTPDMIIQTKNNQIKSIPKPYVYAIQLHELPQGFFTKPTLSWKVHSAILQNLVCQITYRTTNINWSAAYNIVIYQQSNLCDIGGWVTITNRSGKKYQNAKIKLIAGTVNTVITKNNQQKAKKSKLTHFLAVNEKQQIPSFNQKTFADYHLYTLNNHINISQQQTKQIQFIPKVYGVTINQYYEIKIQAGGQPQHPISQKYIKFINSQDNKLGIPFPAGIVRVYQYETSIVQEIQDKTLQFIGQDKISHTAINQNITIHLSKSFAIKSQKYQISRMTTNNVGGYSAELLLKVQNYKNTDAEVVVKFYNLYSDNLKIKMSKGQQYRKMSATQYQWRKILKAGEIWEFGWIENY